jgi:hypothetical protein
VIEIIKGCIHQQIGLKFNEENVSDTLGHGLYGAEPGHFGKYT